MAVLKTILIILILSVAGVYMLKGLSAVFIKQGRTTLENLKVISIHLGIATFLILLAVVVYEPSLYLEAIAILILVQLGWAANYLFEKLGLRSRKKIQEVIENSHNKPS